MRVFAKMRLLTVMALTGALVWALLPQAEHDLRTSEWKELPIGFKSERALEILEAQAESERREWMLATGHVETVVEPLADGAVPPLN
ncbi:MAG: hypothetical protein AAGG56_01165 [Pseudomonadota bacterium]